MTLSVPRILLTAGEPAGIGPDIIVQIAQMPWQAELIVIADPVLLETRAAQLNLPLYLHHCDLNAPATLHTPQHLAILPILLNAPAQPGILNLANAAYVLETLKLANRLCENKMAQAVVTGPVHKACINQAGFAFSGHTEFFAKETNTPHTVMLFVVDELKVALATTHLPLSAVPQAITPALLEQTLLILNQGLQQYFHIHTPRIAVAGLNPHAGEEGLLGSEEIEIISPCLNQLRQQGLHLVGPLSADTLFISANRKEADAILAMYHDQALTAVKALGFDHAVNVTLGLPYLRTSVDHGTALALAGTGEANAGSLIAAVKLAIQLV